VTALTGVSSLDLERESVAPASLANDAESIHTPVMSLKNAALLALIGMVLLTVLVVASFISTVLGVMRDLIPAMALLTSLVHVFTSLSGLVFFYVFHRAQSR
jgi:hypothetical protein